MRCKVYKQNFNRGIRRNIYIYRIDKKNSNTIENLKYIFNEIDIIGIYRKLCTVFSEEKLLFNCT